MRMTPLDIQSHRFRRRVRGVDHQEVDEFLRMVSEDYETLLRENEDQRSRIADLEEQVEALESQERLLQETLVSAQSREAFVCALAACNSMQTRSVSLIQVRHDTFSRDCCVVV